MSDLAHTILQPLDWARPRGFANGVIAQGKHVYIAGQIGWNSRQQFESDDFALQTRQALANIVAVLREAGASPGHLVRMTWYVIDKHEYLRATTAIGLAYKAVIGDFYPAMTLVQVAALVEDRARVEIEATAVIPER